MTEATVDREFAEKFMQAVDEPMKYGVYWLFHEWWAEAPQSAIDGYAAELAAIPEAKAFLAQRYLPEPIGLDRLETCAPGTFGDYYRRFVVENDLLVDLARNYQTYNAELTASGKLDRLPEDMSYMMLRGFQIHDMLHVLTGYDSSPLGELSLASFYLAQIRFPYHAMRLAVTAGHVAYINPTIITPVMDVIAEGWLHGRKTRNLNFERWEEHLDTPLVDLRARLGLDTTRMAVPEAA